MADVKLNDWKADLTRRIGRPPIYQKMVLDITMFAAT
jgi:hypothetical protein